MPQSIKTIFCLLLCALFMTACTTQQTATAPAQTASPHKATFTPGITPSSTPQDLEPKRLFSLGNGEMPLNVEYSPDGKFLFTTYSDTGQNFKVHWLDAQTKKELMSFKHNAIWSRGVLAYSSDNALVAIETDIRQVDIYRMADQQKIFSTDKTFLTVGKTQFSPDNRYLIYQSYDVDSHGPDSLQVWDIQQQKLAYIIPAADRQTWEDYYGTDLSASIPNNTTNPAEGLNNIVVDPNSKFLAVGDNKGGIFVWNLATGKLLHELKGHTQWIAELSLSPDGRLLASGSGDGTVRLWNMPGGTLARTVTGFLGEIESVDFTQDGTQLEVWLDHHPDQIVDVKTGKLGAMEDPDEQPVVPTSEPYQADLLQQGYVYSYSDPSISPDGKTLALIKSPSYISRWNIQTQKVKDFWFVPEEANLEDVGYNAQGEMLALLTNFQSSFVIWNIDRNRQVFPARGWQKIHHTDEYSKNVSLAPKGDFVVATTDNHIEIWDLLKGQSITDLDLAASQNRFGQIFFSPDGSQLDALVSPISSEKDLLLVLDLKSGQQLKSIPLTQHYDSTAMYWPFLAGAVNDDNHPLYVELWNLENNTMQTLQTATDYSSYPSLCFTPDGSLLYLGTNDLKYFWQTSSARLLYQSHDAKFNCSALDANGKRTAISEEGPVEFWDVQPLMQLAHSAAVTPAALPTAERSNTPSPIPTRQPTLAITPVSTPVLPAGAIVPENAAQLKAGARFGQGSIEQMLWPAGSERILTVGSQGMYEYDAKTLVRTSQQLPDIWLKGSAQTSDGRRLIVIQNGEKVQVKEPSTDKLLAEVTGQRPSISPDGTLLAYTDNASYFDRIHLWNIETGQPQADLSALSEVDHAVFSPDSQLLAAVQVNSLHDRLDFSSETVRVWDAHTGQILNGLVSPNAPISSIAFSDDGKYIVGAASGSAWVWPLTTGTKSTAITLDPGHDYSKYFLLFDVRVTSVAISPDDRLLALGTSQNNILLYDWRNNPAHALRKLTTQGDPAATLRFSPDGKQLLSADKGGQLTLWDVQTGKALASQNEHSGPLSGMRFADDGSLLTWTGHTFRAMQPQDASTLHSISIADGKIFDVSPNARLLASYLPYHISLVNAQTGALEQTFKDEPGELVDWRYSDTAKDFTAAAFSSNSKLLTVGGTSDLLFYDVNGNLIEKAYSGYPYPAQMIFSPGNNQVASCTDDCKINVFGEKDAKIYLSDCALQVAFNPAGTLLAGITRRCYYGNVPSNKITLWQVATGETFKTLEIPQASLTSLTFNADGRLLAIGQADGKIVLVEIESLKVLATLNNGNSSIDHIAISNNGQWLAAASADGSIRFWRVP